MAVRSFDSIDDFIKCLPGSVLNSAQTGDITIAALVKAGDGSSARGAPFWMWGRRVAT